MTILLAGLILFFAAHSVSIFARPLRNACVAKSPLGWKAAYSIVALIGFYLIIVGYAEARMEPITLYTPPSWTRHLAMLLMLPVFPLLVAAYLPGKIKGTLKHPMLVATKLWALTHLIVNGNLADLALFGSFLAWAVITRISIKRRADAILPGAGSAKFDIVALVAGLALYVGFVTWGHTHLIGMPIISH